MAIITRLPSIKNPVALRADVTGYASGTYTYSLIVDGKRVGTKQMIAVR